MAAAFPRLRGFISRVHRRAVTLRLIEGAGIGLAAGAVLAMLLAVLRPPISGFVICFGLSAAGAVAGVAWGFLRRPSRLDSAIRADQQLGLDDLLGTATAVLRAGHEREPWGQSVLAIAEAACDGKSSGSIVLNRLGHRSWGAIGLCLAMSLTLAPLLTTSAAPATARAHAKSEPAPLPASPLNRPLIALAPESPLGTHVAGAGEDRQGPAGQQNPDRAPAAQKPPENAAPPPAAAEKTGSTPGDPTGQGSGFGKTSAQPPAAAAQNTAESASIPSVERATGAKTSAGSIAPNAADSAAAPGQTGRTAAAASAATPTPPWRSDHWTSDAKAAEQQLTGGQIAPQYRDLVRKYFEVR